MSAWEAVILAIVEGLTEFLPVSSTGHMIIVSSLLGIASDPFTKTFTVAIQLGAIASVVILYWKKFFQSIDFYFKLFTAFLPAAIVGFLLNDFIDQLLENVLVVACTLILGGIIFLFIDKYFERKQEVEHSLSVAQAIKIGFFQCIAMIPGVSRSASTIIGGLFQGLTKKEAAEFSFFLAVPTMFAASAYKLLSFYKEGNSLAENQIVLLIIGNVVAFVVGMLAIKSFINYLTKHGFKIFGYYRILLGALILLFYFLGIQLSIV